MSAVFTRLFDELDIGLMIYLLCVFWLAAFGGGCTKLSMVVGESERRREVRCGQCTAINNIEQHSADITCYRGYLLSIISNDYGEENMHSQCCGWMFCLPTAPHFMRLHILWIEENEEREGRALTTCQEPICHSHL